MTKDDINPILAEYEDAIAGGTSLNEFVSEHAEHAREIVEYASYQYVFERGAVYNAGAVTKEAEISAINLGREIQARMMAAEGLAPQSAPSLLTSLVESARQLGLTVPDLARKLRVTPLEIVKLNQRLFRPESLPSSFVSRLAESINESMESVSSYLRLAPSLSAQTSYKADSAPRVAEQVDFLDSLKANRTLSEDDRDYWNTQAGAGESVAED